ncbi:MAG TPA: hypothetical protein VLG44_06980 [Chlamydiales bacterium]|nr:hypothetical protein [Chlamydiales bacterium]
MSIPGVSFNQTQDTQSWVEFGRDLVIYTAAFCLPLAAFKTYQAANHAMFYLRNYAQSWSDWYKFSDERASISRAIDALADLTDEEVDAASSQIYRRINDSLVKKGDMGGATNLMGYLSQMNPYLHRREIIKYKIAELHNINDHDVTVAKVSIENAINDLSQAGDSRGASELNAQYLAQLEA